MPNPIGPRSNPITAIGTPLSPSATRVMLLGAGELGKEVIIALQRLGVETIAVDRYEDAPGHQVAHHARTVTMSDPAALRALIEAEKPPRDLWDLKLVPGGLIDLEFVAQCAALTGRVDAPGRPTSTRDILAHLAPGFADAQVRDDLVEAHGLYSMLTQIIRLCLTGAFDRADVPPGLRDLLLRSTDLPDFAVLEAHLQETSRKVREDFDRLLRAKRKRG